MSTITDLQERMTIAVKAAQDIQTAMSTEQDETKKAEMKVQARKHLDEYRTLKAQAEVIVDDRALATNIAEAKAWMSESKGVLPGLHGMSGQATKAQLAEAQDNAREMFYQWANTGYQDERRAYIKARKSAGYTGAYKALSADSDVGAGFVLGPPTLMDGIIAAQKNVLIMRQLCTVRQVPTAIGTGITTMNTDFTGAQWVGETSTVTQDTGLTVSKRELHPQYMSSLFIESEALLGSQPDWFEQFLTDRFAYSFNNIEDQAFISGNGVMKPVGLYETTANGAIPTTRDITAANTTVLVLDDIRRTYWNLKPQYRNSRSTRWVLNRAVLSLVDGITDDNGRPIWNMANIQAGQPEMLYNIPIAESENAPSTTTTGSYVALLGDLSYYWIIDCMAFRVKRLEELYAATMQVGFRGYKAVDGQPMLAEAFTRLKLA